MAVAPANAPLILIRSTSPAAELLNYVRTTDIEVGLLLNFGLKPEFKRLVLVNASKTNRRGN